jgi:hypothetical protein
MSKKILSKKVLTFLLIALPAVLFAQPVLNVNTGLSYSTIQSAIDAPQTLSTHTIQVSAGTYTGGIDIKKTLTLLGPNAAISPNGGIRLPEAVLDLQNIYTPTIRLNANNIVIKGFEIKNSNNAGAIMTGGFQAPHGGSGRGVTLEKNYFHDLKGNAFAASVPSGPDSTYVFTDNKIDRVTSGNFFGGDYGFAFSVSGFSVSSIIICTNNVISNTAKTGLRFTGIKNSTFTGNILSNNNGGIEITKSVNTNISLNEITGSESSGLSIVGTGSFSSSGITVENNKITGHTNGISGEDISSITSLTNNDLSGNTLAINNTGTTTLLAPCNWYGSCISNLNQVRSGPVTIATILNSGTDNSTATGFQPASGTCVSFSECTIQPVTWLDFTGQFAKNNVILNWKTASEQNNTGFDVERSADGRSWSKIGFIPGKINSAAPTPYSYTDLSPLKGLSYYRLKQIDLDNKFSYSRIVQINGLTTDEASIWPNPVTNMLNIGINERYRNEKVYLTVTDMKGTVLVSRTVTHGNSAISTAAWSKALYVVTLRSGRDIIMTKKIIRQ